MMSDNALGCERKNIRPYILGLCFFWGMLLGFLVYINTPSFAQNQEKVLRQEAVEAEQRRATERENPRPVTQAPDFKAVDREPAVIVDVDPLIKQVDIDSLMPPKPDNNLRAVPEPMTVAINTSWGLTGQTTYRPLKPVKLEKKAPVVDFTTRPAPPPPPPVNKKEKPQAARGV